MITRRPLVALLALGALYGCSPPGSSSPGAENRTDAAERKSSKVLSTAAIGSIESRATPIPEPAPESSPTSSRPTTPEAYLHLFNAERVAADVFEALSKKWGGRPFGKLAEAEATHVVAVGRILGRTGNSSTIIEQGKYSMPEFQALYDAMVKRGSVSLEEALSAGAELEEMSLRDLQAWRTEEKGTEARKVFDALIQGSANHLQACLEGRKALGLKEYVPKYLSAEDFTKYAGGSK
ncbi:MAG: DUF2202 domain-containing protein [Fimbriimonadaceae bacterium]|nr:DUF2202 domain-containing protein [Fimbriimonadaceae bacterium]